MSNLHPEHWPEPTPVSVQIARLVLVVITAMVLACVFFWLVFVPFVRPLYAEGSQPFVEVIQTDSGVDTEISFGIYWNMFDGPRVVETSYYDLGAHNNSPYFQFRGSGRFDPPGYLKEDVVWGRTTYQNMPEPYWMLPVLKLEDGTYLSGQPVKILPNTQFRLENSLRMRVDVEGDKVEMFQAGDQLTYRIYITNDGNKPSSTRSAVNIQWGPSLELNPGQTEGQLIGGPDFRPRAIAFDGLIEPGQEVLVARLPFRVASAGSTLVQFWAAGPENFEFVRGKHLTP